MEVADTVRKAPPDDLPQLSAALSKAFFDDSLTACRSPAATWSPAPATVACHWRRRGARRRSS